MPHDNICLVCLGKKYYFCTKSAFSNHVTPIPSPVPDKTLLHARYCTRPTLCPGLLAWSRNFGSPPRPCRAYSLRTPAHDFRRSPVRITLREGQTFFLHQHSYLSLSRRFCLSWNQARFGCNTTHEPLLKWIVFICGFNSVEKKLKFWSLHLILPFAVKPWTENRFLN